MWKLVSSHPELRTWSLLKSRYALISRTFDVNCVFHFASSTLTFKKGLATFLDLRGFIQIADVQNNFSLSNFSHLDLGEYGMLEIVGAVMYISCVLNYRNVRLKQR